jgi:uncharacterized protein YaaW (UPF0174 family)
LKRLVILRVEGKSWAEISKEFKMSENGCKSAYHRHQKEICEILNGLLVDRITQVLDAHVSKRTQLKIVKDLESFELAAHIKEALRL